MNRRSFVSMMLGAAGAPLVPWRGLVEQMIFLPERSKPQVVTISVTLRPPDWSKELERIQDLIAQHCRLPKWMLFGPHPPMSPVDEAAFYRYIRGPQ